MGVLMSLMEKIFPLVFSPIGLVSRRLNQRQLNISNLRSSSPLAVAATSSDISLGLNEHEIVS